MLKAYIQHIAKRVPWSGETTQKESQKGDYSNNPSKIVRMYPKNLIFLQHIKYIFTKEEGGVWTL
jgi:hypothetical protein